MPAEQGPDFEHGGELWNLLEQGGLRILSITTWTDEREQGWLGAFAQKPA